MRVQKWFTVLILVAALLVAVPAFAQDEAIEEEPVELSVTGVVEAIAGTTLTVDGLDYDVAAAEITAVGVLAVGDTVTVVYFVEEEANIAISVIEDEAEDDGEEPVEELTVTGDVEAIVGSIITVGGVDYDASAAFITAVGVLAVGDTVTIVYVVEAEVNVALSIIEDEVIVDDDDDEDDDDGNAPDHSRQYGVGSKCEAEAPEGWVEYTVGEDDTLWSLAVATGSSISQLKFPNCIQNPHDLSAGDVVFLPSTPDPDAQPEHPGRGRNKDRGDDAEDAETESRGNGNGRGNNGKGKGNGNGRGNGGGNGNGNGNGNGKNK
jgi:hypothetical protein